MAARRVRVFIGMSLDGFIAGPEEELDWLQPYDDVDYGFGECIAGVGLIVCGKRTYKALLKHGWGWGFAQPGMVWSDEELPVPAGADISFVRGDAAELMAAARSRTDKDIWIMGGGHVVQQCLAAGLVDELIVGVVPVVLGGGVPLFGSVGRRIPLRLQEVMRYDKGLVVLTYGVGR